MLLLFFKNTYMVPSQKALACQKADPLSHSGSYWPCDCVLVSLSEQASSIKQ